MDVIELLYFVFPDPGFPALYDTSGMSMVSFMGLNPESDHCVKQRFTDRSTCYTVWDAEDEVDRPLARPC